MESLSDVLARILDEKPLSVEPLSGGSIGEVYSVQLANREVVAKVDRGSVPKLDIEGWMLGYLRAESSLPVPEVIHSSLEILVMESLPGASTFSKGAEVDAARMLYKLHSITAKQHGLERDTLIGSLHQPNPLCGNWIDFFRDNRLLNMAREGVREGSVSLSAMTRIEKFASHLDEWLLEPEHPSLLHGDVWTTNVLASGDRITGFIDPAIYYGHPEIELAFITLFGTFGDTFFDVYQEQRAIPDGFLDVRKDIYNLYPLLVHTRLFGGSYLRSVESTIGRFGY
jgi:fructosamine-3-kinase